MDYGLQLPKHKFDALRPGDLEQYLHKRGWVVAAESSTADVGVLYFPAQPDAEILLPRRREYGDYALRMADAVRTLAAVEQRSVWEVLRDVSGPLADANET